MKKTYIQPVAQIETAELNLMIPVGSDGVDDGFTKERQDLEEEIMENFPPKNEWQEGMW